jgi:hypothetical protein
VENRADTDSVRRGALGALILLAAIGLLASCAPVGTKGTMPPPGPNGEVDPRSVPDFLAVAGREDGIAGYARSGDVLGASDRAFPVYADDLRTVVGQMVPGKGFIPAGVDPDTVPDIPVEAGPVDPNPPDGSRVTLYVRNDSPAILNVAVLTEGAITEAVGFWGRNLGVGCFSMALGSRLVVLAGEPSNAIPLVRQLLYTRGPAPEGVTIWIAMNGDGAITQGRDVPAWWGDPQAC